jgi:hypothetical protein
MARTKPIRARNLVEQVQITPTRLGDEFVQKARNVSEFQQKIETVKKQAIAKEHEAQIIRATENSLTNKPDIAAWKEADPDKRKELIGPRSTTTYGKTKRTLYSFHLSDGLLQDFTINLGEYRRDAIQKFSTDERYSLNDYRQGMQSIVDGYQKSLEPVDVDAARSFSTSANAMANRHHTEYAGLLLQDENTQNLLKYTKVETQVIREIMPAILRAGPIQDYNPKDNTYTTLSVEEQINRRKDELLTAYRNTGIKTSPQVAAKIKFLEGEIDRMFVEHGVASIINIQTGDDESDLDSIKQNNDIQKNIDRQRTTGDLPTFVSDGKTIPYYVEDNPAKSIEIDSIVRRGMGDELLSGLSARESEDRAQYAHSKSVRTDRATKQNTKKMHEILLELEDPKNPVMYTRQQLVEMSGWDIYGNNHLNVIDDIMSLYKTRPFARNPLKVADLTEHLLLHGHHKNQLFDVNQMVVMVDGDGNIQAVEGGTREKIKEHKDEGWKTLAELGWNYKDILEVADDIGGRSDATQAKFYDEFEAIIKDNPDIAGLEPPLKMTSIKAIQIKKTALSDYRRKYVKKRVAGVSKAELTDQKKHPETYLFDDIDIYTSQLTQDKAIEYITREGLPRPKDVTPKSESDLDILYYRSGEKELDAMRRRLSEELNEARQQGENVLEKKKEELRLQHEAKLPQLQKDWIALNEQGAAPGQYPTKKNYKEHPLFKRYTESDRGQLLMFLLEPDDVIFKYINPDNTADIYGDSKLYDNTRSGGMQTNVAGDIAAEPPKLVEDDAFAFDPEGLGYDQDLYQAIGSPKGVPDDKGVYHKQSAVPVSELIYHEVWSEDDVTEYDIPFGSSVLLKGMRHESINEELDGTKGKIDYRLMDTPSGSRYIGVPITDESETAIMSRNIAIQIADGALFPPGSHYEFDKDLAKTLLGKGYKKIVGEDEKPHMYKKEGHKKMLEIVEDLRIDLGHGFDALGLQEQTVITRLVALSGGVKKLRKHSTGKMVDGVFKNPKEIEYFVDRRKLMHGETARLVPLSAMPNDPDKVIESTGKRYDLIRAVLDARPNSRERAVLFRLLAQSLFFEVSASESKHKPHDRKGEWAYLKRTTTKLFKPKQRQSEAEQGARREIYKIIYALTPESHIHPLIKQQYSLDKRKWKK